MIRGLLKLAVLLVVGILVYNYFFGDPQEKAQSEKVFTEIKDVGKSAIGLLKSEKEKYKEGKYDGALDKIGGLFEDLSEKAKAAKDSRLLERLSDLEKKRQELQNNISQQNDTPAEYGNSDESAKINQEWDRLISETESLLEDIKKKE